MRAITLSDTTENICLIFVNLPNKMAFFGIFLPVTPPNAAVAGFSITPPPPVIGSRRAAAADHRHPARRRRQNGVGLGLYL